jgi:hypothetical protein
METGPRRGGTPSAESLEPRMLFAGDVRAGVDLGLLSVTGDEADNAILVTKRYVRMRGEGGAPTFQRSIVITGLWKDGAPTTVNGGRSAAFSADGINDVIIDMAGGDDWATVFGLRVPGVLGMDGGDFGNDTISVHNTRADRLFIRMGEGNDQLLITGTTVTGLASLTGEDGFDALVVLGSTFGSKDIRDFEFMFPRTL